MFRGNTSEALSTYGLVIPKDSPNTGPDGDYELDGFANLGAGEFFLHQSEPSMIADLAVENDWGTASINITRVGNFTKAPYEYTLTALSDVEKVVKAGAGLGKL